MTNQKWTNEFDAFRSHVYKENNTKQGKFCMLDHIQDVSKVLSYIQSCFQFEFNQRPYT